MTELPRGANAPLPARRVTATVSCAVPVDVSALTVDADLQARSDADLVFYNAPRAPECAGRRSAAGSASSWTWRRCRPTETRNRG